MLFTELIIMVVAQTLSILNMVVTGINKSARSSYIYGIR